MSDLLVKIFGPLDKSACVYFLIITAFFFIAFVSLLGVELFVLVRDFKKLNMSMVFRGVMMGFNIFLAYFVNRLLYTMCSKSLI
jgi:hypothetical protein